MKSRKMNVSGDKLNHRRLKTLSALTFFVIVTTVCLLCSENKIWIQSSPSSILESESGLLGTENKKRKFGLAPRMRIINDKRQGSFLHQKICAQKPSPSSVPKYSREESKDHLKMKLPKFLKNFKNPCWFESTPEKELYKDNPLPIFRNHQAVIQKVLQGHPDVRLRCLPYFFLAGFPKCGTTDLYVRLTSHPEIYTPLGKEPHFWSKMHFRSQSTITDYIDYFDGAAKKIHQSCVLTSDKDVYHAYHTGIVGDSSASTLWYNHYWRRYPGNHNISATEPDITVAHYVKHILPNAKIIAILRNPIDRTYSDYLYFTKWNKSVDDFHEVVTQSINQFQNCVKNSSLRACAYSPYPSEKRNRPWTKRVHVGLYHVYIKDWLKLFPREQMFFVRLEDYHQDTEKVLREIFKFLELNEVNNATMQHILNIRPANTRKKDDQDLGPMLPDTRDLLAEFYIEHNKELARVLENDAYLWKD